MKVLHLASFDGNAGDYANNKAFHRIFEEDIGKAEFTQVEIREFEHRWGWGIRKWEDLISQANQHDLFVIGGGNFLTLDDTSTKTGTIIDLTPEMMEQIDTPILFNRVGLHNYANDDELKKKFKPVFDYIMENCMLTVRNDGSKEDVKRMYGVDVIETPDAGHFYTAEGEQKKLIGINICSDTVKHLQYSEEMFYEVIADFAWMFLLNFPEYEIVFLPHIYSDLKAVNNVLPMIPDEYVRRRIKVAPYGEWEKLFEYYAQCEVITGVRFHSNICSMAMEIPTVALVHITERVYYLYEKLGMKDRIMATGEYDKNLYRYLFKKVAGTIENKDEIKAMYKDKNKELREKAREVNLKIKEWGEL